MRTVRSVTNADGVVAEPSGVIGYEAKSVYKLLTDPGYLADWTYGTDFQFLCLGTKQDIIDDLASPDPQCLVAAMGLDITELSLTKGIKFSYFPTDRAGVAPFHWSVWVTWIVITLVLVVVLYVCETATADPSNRFTKGWAGFRDSAFNATFFSLNRKGPTLGELGSTPARVLSIFTIFFFMIFLQLYTAQLAGLLAAKNIRGTVTGVDDLKNGDFTFFYPSDIAESVTAAGLASGDEITSWSFEDTPEAHFFLMDNAGSTAGAHPAVEALYASGAVNTKVVPDALLLKSSEAQLAAAEYCNLFVVGSPFQITTQALAFPAVASNTTVLAFSVAQAQMQMKEAYYDASKIEAQINTFKTKNFKAATCPGKSAASKTQQIKFKQANGMGAGWIEGLLVILGIGIGLALFLVAIAWEWQRQHYRTLRAGLPRWRGVGSRKNRAAPGNAKGFSDGAPSETSEAQDGASKV
ncbi:hypothetical protein COHA_005959 [Chlorella ohadii]|uniref:Ionotropic glutamate receptor C-terminal domain-containing protein n=1 Tax=Chlorella ohadii TaxID=2649997 RepID=A0AAD5DNG4_9CHLO|nr:hypothetical protein COHA_005959 [Chlorella ohadii]